MAFPEEYYIHIEGKQKGPYSYPQLKHLYDKSLIAEETLYWREGLDQWQPLSDLIGLPLPKQIQKRRRAGLLLLGALLVIACFVAYLAPMLADGWREANQDELTAEAAYWKARGFVRDEIRKQNATVAFDDFSPEQVVFAGERSANVTLPGKVFPRTGTSAAKVWRLALEFRSAQREWHLVKAEELKPSAVP